MLALEAAGEPGAPQLEAFADPTSGEAPLPVSFSATAIDPDGGPVTIIGRGDLAVRYQSAFEVLGLAAQIAPPGMAQRGLWDIARMGGLT